MATGHDNTPEYPAVLPCARGSTEDTNVDIDFAAADVQKRPETSALIVAGLLSACTHVVLLLVLNMQAGDMVAISGSSKPRPAFSVHIERLVEVQPPEHTATQPDEGTAPTAPDPSPAEQIQKEPPNKREPAQLPPETANQDANEASPQVKDRPRIITEADIEELSRSAYSMVPDAYEPRDNPPAATGSGKIFSPTLRRQLDEAQRRNRGRQENIEDSNNRWTSRGEVVSAGDKCFLKQEMIGTGGQTNYYRTACAGQRTESEIMAGSLEEAMKSKK